VVQFEEMMDRLEKSCGQTVLSLVEAKALLKEDDELIDAVYDYWLTKRLHTVKISKLATRMLLTLCSLQLTPLIPQVKTESRLPGMATNNPYLAFRRRTEKMQTRKNRKNDEASYEKMLKLRRDLYRAITLLELVKRREKHKRENLHLAIDIYEKRYISILKCDACGHSKFLKKISKFCPANQLIVILQMQVPGARFLWLHCERVEYSESPQAGIYSAL
jgi:enhancer of polycomb-like protein